MQKTQNYQLNQWDVADPIRREDFNADNQKIDGALGELETALAGKSAFVKLKEMTLTADTTSVTVSVSDIDWSRWQYVHVDINLNNGSQGQLALNGTSTLLTTLPGVWSSTFSNPQPRLTLCPGRWPDRDVAGYSTTFVSCDSVKFRNLKTLVFHGTTYYTGGKIILWGEE